MAKRFTSTDKWADPWFRKLSDKHKLFWQYILDNCNSAGIWNADLETAAYYIGHEIDLEDIKSAFNGRIEVLNEQYWWLPKFPIFQYGRLSDGCKPHRPVIDLLKRFGLWERVSKGFQKSIETLQDKDKEKEKETLEGGVGEGTKRFKKPAPQEVTEYAASIKFRLDGERFIDHYESNGWMVGKSKMKDWKAAIRQWKRNSPITSNIPPEETPQSKALLEAKAEELRSLADRVYERRQMEKQTSPGLTE